jgi:hypothetical protein
VDAEEQQYIAFGGGLDLRHGGDVIILQRHHAVLAVGGGRQAECGGQNKGEQLKQASHAGLLGLAAWIGNVSRQCKSGFGSGKIPDLSP